MPLIHELVRKRINEKTDLSASYRVIRLQVRGRGEVGNKFQKNQRFGELERFWCGRPLVHDRSSSGLVDVVMFSILRGKDQRTQTVNLRGGVDPWSVPFGLVLKVCFVFRVGGFGLLQCNAGTLDIRATLHSRN